MWTILGTYVTFKKSRNIFKYSQSFSELLITITLPRSSHPPSFWSGSYLQLVFLSQGAGRLNNCHLLLLSNILEMGLFPLNKLCARSNINKSCKWRFSRKLPGRPNRWGFREAPTWSAPSSGLYIAGFHSYHDSDTPNATMELGPRGWE